MTKRTLTLKQIEQLHEFCTKHYVPYYDLQVELVDHMASAIESRWEKEPEIGFDQALHETYNAFGITGFSKVRIEKERGLQRKYKHLLWSYIGQFFKLPKIILTISLSILLFIVFRLTEKDSVIVITYLLILVVLIIIYYAYIYPKYLKIKVSKKRKLLIVSVLNQMQGGLTTLPIALFNFSYFIWVFNKPSYIIWIEMTASVLMVISFFFVIAFYFYVPGKIKMHFEEQFPQFVNT